MTANPDINRLSLEDRIRALEARPIPPSGGGGGGSGGGGSGSSADSPKLVHKFERRFNPIERVTGGWAQYFSLSYLDQGSTLNNWELNLRVYYPEWQGMIWGATTVVVYLHSSSGSNVADGAKLTKKEPLSGSQLDFLDSFGFSKTGNITYSMLNIRGLKWTAKTSYNPPFPESPSQGRVNISVKFDVATSSLIAELKVTEIPTGGVSTSSSTLYGVLLRDLAMLQDDWDFSAPEELTVLGGYPSSPNGCMQVQGYPGVPNHIGQFIPDYR